MPLYYDLSYAFTSSGSAGTEVNEMWGHTVATQETVNIIGLYGTCRGGVAGGASLRLYANTGTTASGGTAQTPQPKNLRLTAAQSLWFNAGTAITSGGTRLVRYAVGLAQTGGQGGYIPITPFAGVQMITGTTNPVDVEITNLCNGSSIPIDMTLEIGEGVG
jgi:hypothetical protein